MPITSNPRSLVGRPKLVTAPTLEPVSFEDARLHGDYPGADQTMLESKLVTARQLAEAWTGRAFCPQKWTLTFDVGAGLGGPMDDFWYTDTPQRSQARYLPRVIELPRPPLISVESVKWYDEDDTATTLSSSTVYRVSTSGMCGRLSLRAGAVWPSGMREIDSLVITFWAGYGTAPEAGPPEVAATEDVPAAIKDGIVEWAAHMYENREGQQAANAGGAVVLNRGSFIPAGVQTKLSIYRTKV